MVKLLFFWEELKSTFWFTPILIIILTLAAACGLIYMDSVMNYTPNGIVTYIFTGSIDSARSVLSTISGAMIGVAGTVFSITLVALTLASSQFGSRLLRNFMHERTNQIVLGSYVSTYLYCLIVLNAIRDNSELTFIPSFSVIFAILLAIANIVLLIIFIHHIAISIQANKVIYDIYLALYSSVHSLFPKELSDDNSTIEHNIEKLKASYASKTSIPVKTSGYLQHINNEKLLELATENDLFIEINYKSGNYVIEGEILFNVYSKEDIEDPIKNTIADTYITGNIRTPQQDAEFYILQIEEIALRALSPGINDPHTAIACIDNLTSAMAYLTKVKFPSPFWQDDNDILRVKAEVLNYPGMMDASYNQIRQYSAGNPSVVIRLMDALIALDRFSITDEHKTTIKTHAKKVMRVGEQSFKDPIDLEDLKMRSDQLLN